MPVFEDKIAQRSVSMLMSVVYEHYFYDFSYGFREGRSAHQAVGELREQCYRENIHWIIDADVTKFIDNLDHGEEGRKRGNYKMLEVIYESAENRGTG